jgi:hypothetical protein
VTTMQKLLSSRRSLSPRSPVGSRAATLALRQRGFPLSERAVSRLLRRLDAERLTQPASALASVDHHQEIIAAIAACDPDRAETTMSQHLSRLIGETEAFRTSSDCEELLARFLTWVKDPEVGDLSEREPGRPSTSQSS